MDNKLITYSNNDNNKTVIKNPKSSVSLGSKQILGIIITLSLIIILIFIKTYFNGPNRLKRYLTKEGYQCASNICEKDNGVTKYEFNFRSGNLTVKNNDYSFVINDSNYIYSKNDDNLTCTYDNNGDLVKEEYNNSSSCTKYHNIMNDIINYYNLTMESSKFKKK